MNILGEWILEREREREIDNRRINAQ